MATTAVTLKSPPTGPDAPAQTTQADGGIPEKFLKDGQPDVQAILKSYRELESKLSSGSPEATPATPSPDPAKPDAPKADGEQPQDSQGGVFDKYTQEFASTGALSPESYKELEARGISKAYVDAYIEGVKATTQKQAADIYGIVGSEADYQKMIAFAQKSLSPAEAKAYDDAVLSGDMGRIKLAVEALQARWHTAEGKAPKLAFGQGTPGPDVYESQEQWLADIRNPKYAADPAFRKKVEAKLQRSNW